MSTTNAVFYVSVDLANLSSAGTSLLYSPGILEGGTLEHNCSLQRSIGYFLEPLLMLAPFAKRQMRITLYGITNGTEDPSVSKALIIHVVGMIWYQLVHWYKHVEISLY